MQLQVEYYDDEKTMIYSIYTTNNYDVQEGLIRYFHKNGWLEKECYAIDFEMMGPVKRYYDNGQLFESFTFTNGSFDGLYRRWHDNGRLAAYWTYAPKTEHGFIGDYEMWDRTGKPIVARKYESNGQVQDLLSLRQKEFEEEQSELSERAAALEQMERLENNEYQIALYCRKISCNKSRTAHPMVSSQYREQHTRT